MSNIRNLCELLLSIFLNQLITLAVFFHLFTFNISHNLEFILPISFLAGLISLILGQLKKFTLWPFKVIKQWTTSFTSTLSTIFASLVYLIPLQFILFSVSLLEKSFNVPLYKHDTKLSTEYWDLKTK